MMGKVTQTVRILALVIALQLLASKYASAALVQIWQVKDGTDSTIIVDGVSVSYSQFALGTATFKASTGEQMMVFDENDSTALQGEMESVDSNGLTYTNYLGIHLHFSESSLFGDFTFADIDVAQHELVTSFGFNGVDFVMPNEISKGSSVDAVSGVTFGNSIPNTELPLGAVFPATISAYLGTTAGNTDTDDTNAHVTLDYGPNALTDVYFLYALKDNWTGPVNTFYSGTAILDASPVPEPTSLALWSGLCVMGLIAARRRRRAA